MFFFRKQHFVKYRFKSNKIKIKNVYIKIVTKKNIFTYKDLKTKVKINE